jgi:3-oxoadipate enol-lactonase
MPKLRVNGAELHYEDSGRGAEAIVFGHGFLFSTRMFDLQVAALKDRYRCIALDWRGQGQSELTAGGYDMDTLTEDAVQLIEKLGAGPCHFVGLSMGGFMGMRIALRRPELLRSLVLLETSADPEPPENIPGYRRLTMAAQVLPLRLLMGKVSRIMLGKASLEDPSRAAERKAWRALMEANRRRGISRGLEGITTRKPVIDEIARIRTPTLIMVGEQDVATVPEKSRRIHERIPGSRLVMIPRAGHSSTLEQPAFVNAELERFLAEVAGRRAEASVASR